MTDEMTLKKLLIRVLTTAGVAIPETQFPVIIRKGVNTYGKKICYYLNYSAEAVEVKHSGGAGVELLSDVEVTENMLMNLDAWNVKIVEEAHSNIDGLMTENSIE